MSIGTAGRFVRGVAITAALGLGGASLYLTLQSRDSAQVADRLAAEQAGRIAQVDARAARLETQLAAVAAAAARLEGRVNALVQENAQSGRRIAAAEQQLREAKELAAEAARPPTPPPAATPDPRAAAQPPQVAPAGPAARPAPAATPDGRKVYRVKSGDILERIAREHGCTIEAIQEANPGLDPKRLRIGADIRIP